MPVPVVKLTATQVLALACFGIAVGNFLKRRLPILDTLNIPSPIVGGMLYAVLTMVLHDRVINFEMDLVLQNLLMNAFFTTIGMGASLALVKRGGVQVVLFFALATVGAVLQNAVGIGLAKMFDLSPLLGIISGSVALTGGPATALAFGQTFEDMGVKGAGVLGVASAMVGITAGGLIGGFIGGWLIRHHGLLSGRPTKKFPPVEQIAYSGDPAPEPISSLAEESESEQSALMISVVAIAVAMGIGSLISMWLQTLSLPWDPSRKLTLPSYVGAMMAAAIIRNLDDRFKLLNISQRHVDSLGNIALYVFIVMALLTLQLWEIARLALPFLVMLAGQIALVFVMCIWMSYYVMGRDYESAVMAGGFCGFMLGTTANAMACMEVITQKHGPAPRAFIVVPLVGAFLIDFTNALIITAMANFFR